MTGQTGGMLGKITDVRKGGVAFTYSFPILRGNFVARAASELLRDGVSLVRELCVIDARFLRRRDFLLGTTALGAGLICVRPKARRYKNHRRRQHEHYDYPMPDPHYCWRMVSCSPASGFDPDGLFAGHKQTPAAVNNRAGVYVAQTFPQTWSLLSSSKIKPQGRVRQVRVIILRSRLVERS